MNYQIDLGEVEFKRRSGDLGNKLVIGKAFCEELHLSDCDKMFNGSDSLKLVRISVNPIGRFGFIRSLFHLLFRPCSFTLSDRIGLVFSSIRQPVQFDDCCAINGRVMHLPQWGY